MHLDSASRLRLVEVFAQAQQRGWLGPQSLDACIDHSLAFACAASAVPGIAVDLGSGGGVPALVLAAVWPQCHWTLVESSLPRAAFLELHRARLGWANRVTVRHASAQSLSEDGQHRGRADLVTARSFGPPEVLIAAAAPLLRPGGELIVSAAPRPAPWPSQLLASHSLAPDNPTQSPPHFHRTTRLGIRR